MIRVGARSSKLSVAQTKKFTERLTKNGFQVEYKFGKSMGDNNNVAPIHMIGKDGVFTSFLEKLLLEKEIDIAVHSMKDLPILETPGIVTLPVLPRENPADILIVRKELLHRVEEVLEIKSGTRIATSSVRRQSQLTHTFPNCMTIDVRGNIDTRVRKLKDGWYDGLILSAAALIRLPQNITEEYEIVELPLSIFPTAPAQGQLAVQLRAEDHELIKSISDIALSPEKDLVEFERAFYAQRGKGCIDPIGITIIRKEDKLELNYYDGIGNFPFRYSIQAEDLNKLQHYMPTLINQRQYHVKNEPELKSLIVTQHEDTSLVKDLRQKGYLVYPLSVVNVTPLEFTKTQISDLANQIQEATWVLFTSKRGARYLPDELKAHLLNTKIAALGDKTAIEIRDRQLPVHYISTKSSSKDLINEIIQLEPISKIVYISGSESTGSIEEICETTGIELIRIITYKVEYDVPPKIVSSFRSSIPQNVPILVTSPMVAKTILEHFPDWKGRKWVVIGERTKQTLLEYDVEETKISFIQFFEKEQLVIR